MACDNKRIFRNSAGEITKVLAPNGEESILYNDILGIVSRESGQEADHKEQALKLWAQAYSKQFKNWFGNWEAQQPVTLTQLIARDPIYSAVFLDTNKLVSKYPQVHPNLQSHHSTIEFRPKDLSDIPIGDRKNIKITGRLTTNKVDVLIVDNPLSKNEFPHITLSTAEGVKPFESNSEIKNNQDKIVKLDDTIPGIVGVLDRDKGEVTTPQPVERPVKQLPGVSKSVDENGEPVISYKNDVPIFLNVDKKNVDIDDVPANQTKAVANRGSFARNLDIDKIIKEENLNRPSKEEYIQRRMALAREKYPELEFTPDRFYKGWRVLVSWGSNTEPTNQYHQLDIEDATQYGVQADIKKTKKKQRKVAQEMLDIRREVVLATEPNGSLSLDEEGNSFYIHEPTDTQLTRTGTIIDTVKNGYYGFDGDENLFRDNREWGNQVDDILRGVILGESLKKVQKRYKQGRKSRRYDGSDAYLNENTVKRAYNFFTKHIAKYPNDIILSQQPLFNLEKGIAGTADVVIIKPNGKIKIADLKSSVKPTEGTYEIEGDNGKFYKNSYEKKFVTKDGEKKASKRQRHQAQLSLYKGLALAQGFEFIDDNEITVWPIFLNEVKDDEVLSIYEEKEIAHNSSRDIVEIVYNDAESDKSPHEIESYNIVLEKIRKLLQDRLDVLRKEGKTRKVYFVEKLAEAIEETERVKGIVSFINDTNRYFLGSKKNNWIGATKIIELKMRKLENGTYDGTALEAINELREEMDTALLYETIVKELADLFRNVERENKGWYNPKKPQKGSPIDKLRNIRDSIDSIKYLYDRSVNPLIAKVLNEEASSGMNEEVQVVISNEEERLEKYKRDTNALNLTPGSDRYITRKKKEREKEEKIKALKEKLIVSEDIILRELNSGSIDIPMQDLWLTPAISSSNKVVALVAKTVKKHFNEARNKARVFSLSAVKDFEKFKKENPQLNQNNVAEFNDGLFETVKLFMGVDEDGDAIFTSEKLAFVQKFDVNKFHKEKAAMEVSAKLLPQQKRKKFRDNWYKENAELVSKQEIKRIIKEKKKIFSEDEYRDWKRYNITTTRAGITRYGRAFLQPKESMYTNQRYTELTQNKSKFEYYTRLLNFYFDSQKRLPNRNTEEEKYLLPAIRKNSNDRFRENGIINYFSETMSSSYQYLADDNELTGEEPVGSNHKVIPLLFRQDLDIQDVSVDLLSSVVRFEEASLRYAAASKVQNVSEAALEAIEKKDRIETDWLGRKVIDKNAKKLGIEGWEKYKKKHNGNNVAALLSAFIDMNIYGMHQKREAFKLPGTNKVVDFGKIANTLSKLISLTTFPGNVLLSTANYLQGSVMGNIEAASKQFFSYDDWYSAGLEYGKKEVDFIKDMSEPIHKSLIGQMVDVYDALQGEFTDKFGRKISHGALKKTWSTDSLFQMQHKGEHAIQVRTMIAYLKRIKVDHEGKKISLYDAYELGDNGIIQLKPGVKLEGSVSEDGLLSFDAMNVLHGINKRMHGIYNTFDQSKAQQYATARLMMMFRKFAVPGYKKRFKGIGIDQEIGAITEGTYRTFFRVATSDFGEMLKMWNNTSDLTDYERQNVRRTTVDLAWIFSTWMLTNAIRAIAESAPDLDECSSGDEECIQEQKDRKRRNSYALYLSLRLNSELFFYINPMDTFRIMRSPTVAFSLVERTYKFFIQSFSPTETYKRDTGFWEKGDSKLWARFLQLLGFTGNNIKPEQAVKSLERWTGK